MAALAQTSRRRMTFDARREQLLDVTARLALEGSFHEITIEAVAQRAGITRAVVYQHFGELETLLRTVVERETERAMVQVSETTPSDLSDGDPQTLMLDSLHAFLTAARDHPVTWGLVLMPPEGAPEILRQSIARGRALVLARLTSAVQPVLEKEPQAPDAELTARVLSAVSDEYARLVLIDSSRFSPERLVRHASSFLQGALR
jgi:AcrR family transcriptional regulator